MLKTNSKKAKENIKKYIINNFNFEDNTEEIGEGATFEQVAQFIYARFWDEVGKWRTKNMRESEADSFEYWASGLPSTLNTCYYYNRPAVDDLGDILEETAEERARFDEMQAEKMLTYLIYREIKGAQK